MRVVGIRELKDRLSEYVRITRSGEEVLVTDHGEVVAELRRPERIRLQEHFPPRLAELVAQGVVSPGAKNKASLYPSVPRLLKRGQALQLLEEERGEH